LFLPQSLESVELALKGVLRLFATEPPKWHDVGPILKRHRVTFPQWFRDEIDEVSSISRRLRRKREPYMYGDEETGTTPDQLYSLMDAREASEYAKRVLGLYRKLLKEYEGNQ
jgi:HEPN domain-containing protein